MNHQNLVTIPAFTLTKQMLVYLILIATLLITLVLAANHLLESKQVENLKQLPNGLSTEQAVKSILLVSSENILSKDFENLVDQTNINAIQYLSDSINLPDDKYDLALKTMPKIVMTF